ncbi:MAG: RNA polymerase factor sigma-54, partial [Gammaproteobacteria bacterium]|nr:RNA polymerase factor sigma-54 [Gammaproteobacteria bacterium]
MKQSLELKLGQRLTMTPQLQQAIRLLQLSSLELQTEIREALEENPLLEEKEAEHDEPEEGEARGDTTNNDEQPVRDSDLELADGTALADTSDLPSDWAEEFETPIASNVRNSNNDLSFDYDGRNSSPITLRDHLEWQFGMTPCSEIDRAIGQGIIDSLSEDGYLSCELHDIQQALAGDIEVDLDEIEAVLHLIQNFDPSGIGARDLSECLVIQLRQMAANTPGLNLAMEVAERYLESLGKRDFVQLKRALKATDTDLQEAITLIQSLNPRPGSLIDSAQASYVIPDIVVKKIGDNWLADL